MTGSTNSTVTTGPSTRATRSGRSLRADARQNRNKIIDAARELFASGVDAVSMEDIAHRAGVSAGTLARNFPKRDDLVAAVYQRGLDSLRGLAESLEESTDPWEALRTWLHEFLRFSQLTRSMLGGFARVVQRDPDVAKRDQELDVAFGAVFQRALDAGAVREGLTQRDAIHLVGSLVFSIAADHSRSEFLFTVLVDGLAAQ